LGQGDVAESPIAVPKVRRTNESAEARTAPASIAPHSRNLGTTSEGTSPGGIAARAGPTSVIGLPSPAQRSAEAKEAQDEHDHDDQPNQINDAIHDPVSAGTTSLYRDRHDVVVRPSFLHVSAETRSSPAPLAFLSTRAAWATISLDTQRRSRGCLLVHRRLGDLREKPVGLLLLLEVGCEEVDGVVAAELLRPGDECAVARDLVVLDSLG
jgi:hypothetical protein